MKDIKDVYLKMQDKKKERSGLAKMIRDELANRDDYRQLTDELKQLREKKKSIENEVKAGCLSDVAQMDTLRLEISSASELISDIALTMYTSGQTVEILDEDRGVRLTPVFSVKFQKENLEVGAAKEKAPVESQPEPALAAAGA